MCVRVCGVCVFLHVCVRHDGMCVSECVFFWPLRHQAGIEPRPQQREASGLPLRHQAGIEPRTPSVRGERFTTAPPCLKFCVCEPSIFYEVLSGIFPH